MIHVHPSTDGVYSNSGPPLREVELRVDTSTMEKRLEAAQVNLLCVNHSIYNFDDVSAL